MANRPSRTMGVRFASILAGVFLLLLVNANTFAASSSVEEAATTEKNAAEVESLLAVLEDPEQRDVLVQRLRSLAENTVETDSAADAVSFKTATTELVKAVATRAEALGESISRLVGVGDEPPTLVEIDHNSRRIGDHRGN